MSTTLRIESDDMPKKNGRGGQHGNQNAAKPDAKDELRAFRCKPEDAARWEQAAEHAYKAGLLPEGGRSHLAAWIIMVLNRAAARSEPEPQPEPPKAKKRKKA